MNEITLDEIMKCSKEAIARAFVCSRVTTHCCLGDAEKCPWVCPKCYFITPQDWHEVMDERNGGEACIKE